MYMYPSGKFDAITVEGVFKQQRFNLISQKTEWLINADGFMTRTGLKNNENPSMVWAEENLCLRSDGSSK